MRRLRGEHERRRREVQGGAEGVTNLLFDGAAARVAHVRLGRTSTNIGGASRYRQTVRGHECVIRSWVKQLALYFEEGKFS